MVRREKRSAIAPAGNVMTSHAADCAATAIAMTLGATPAAVSTNGTSASTI
jgi:hypothetical protein